MIEKRFMLGEKVYTMKKAVVYIALDNVIYLNLATIGCKSLRRFGAISSPYEVILLTNLVVTDKCWDRIISLDPEPEVFKYGSVQTQLLSFCPGYDQLLYLDSDTVIKSNLTNLWNMFGDKELVMNCHTEPISTLKHLKDSVWFKQHYSEDLELTSNQCQDTDKH